MSRPRVCGKTCHHAKGAKCRCWCGGLFHGSGGKEAREAFVQEFSVDTVPTMERTFLEATGQRGLFTEDTAGERWRGALAAAVSARSQPAAAPAEAAV